MASHTTSWWNAILASLAQVTEAASAAVPTLLSALVLVAIGLIAAKLSEIAIRQLLVRLRLDRGSERLGLSRALAEAGLHGSTAQLTARLAFWLVLVTFLLASVNQLGIGAVGETLDRLAAFLPRLVAAGVILFFGILLARVVRNVVGPGAAAMGLGDASRIGAAAGHATALVVVVVALEQLGVDTAILVAGVTALLATLGLGFALAFGLGARPIVTHVLAGRYLRESLTAGSTIELEGRRGVIERIGTVDTVVRGDADTWSVPNGRLLDAVVGR
jgi:hypothetical protein